LARRISNIVFFNPFKSRVWFSLNSNKNTPIHPKSS
jgi:hypothetical protein